MDFPTQNTTTKTMTKFFASEIVFGYRNMSYLRDFIIETINILTRAVESKNLDSRKFRASYGGYIWHIQYKNTGIGKVWLLTCWTRSDEICEEIYRSSSDSLADKHLSGMFSTMNELVNIFTVEFPEIVPELETYMYASTIKIR